MTVRTCCGTTRDGRPCSAQARPGTTTCPWHDPQLAQHRAEWSRQGGRNSSNKARARRLLPAEPLSAEEIRVLLGLAFKGVIAGKVEPGVGTAAATIARALLDVARVAELEAQLAEMRRDLASFADRRSAS